MPDRTFMSQNQYRWARPGDVNAFFGLMLDNIAGLVLTVSLLYFNFGFPVEFALAYMVPGTAIGVLVGDLLYFRMAFRMAKNEGRDDVTAMPLGLDTPSTIGMVFFVLGPAFSLKLEALAEAAGRNIQQLKLDAAADNAPAAVTELLSTMQWDAAMHAWKIGICALLMTGLIKIVCAFFSTKLRDLFPRAGLLGSLAAIALVLIAFIQFQKITESPIVGFAAMIIVLITLIARVRLPWKIPGALAAVLVGCAIHYGLRAIESGSGMVLLPPEPPAFAGGGLTDWMIVFQFGWLGSFNEALGYMPYILPFAIATVIGGIDCAESAASAGDDFDTRKVIGVEAFATIVAALCGGVIQNTPYIGHPAYKAMGARSAYVLATALFVGGAGLFGYFMYIFQYIPEVAILPILVFIGLEITAQSFHATPKRHYAAVAIAFVPAMAKLVMIYLDQFLKATVGLNLPEAIGDGRLEGLYMMMRMLAGGFIITSLIWSAALAKIIDRRMAMASFYFAIGGILVLFGVMHTPLDGEKMFLPWNLKFEDPAVFSSVIQYTLGYLVMALILFLLGLLMKNDLKDIDSDSDFESLEA